MYVREGINVVCGGGRGRQLTYVGVHHEVAKRMVSTMIIKHLVQLDAI